jgi:hypothetical protein
MDMKKTLKEENPETASGLLSGAAGNKDGLE